jgi:Domain of Unknown Function (DUF930)
MEQTPKPPISKFAWGIPASVSAHAIVLALLIFGLPSFTFAPDDVEAIDVTLVPPPQPEKQEQPSELPAQEIEKDASTTPDQPEEQPETPSLQVLQPVFEFSEEDAGPQHSLGEASTEAEAPVPNAAEEQTPEPDQPEQETRQPEIQQAEAEGTDAPVPDPTTVAVPSPRPAPPTTETRTANSQQRTEDRVATTAIGSIPRGIRAGELCATALREQLRRSMPPYWPDLLPAYRLDEGTVLEVRKGAFRSHASWYDLSFHCEINADATKVVAFDFNVGEPIPPSEWKSRGFPSN